MFAVDLVDLLRHPDEGGSLGHLLDLAGANVGAGRPQPAQDVLHGVSDVTSVIHLRRNKLKDLK